jgi:hypothetical protein
MDETGITPSYNYNISQLHKWLDFELGSSALLIMSYFFGFAFIFAVVAAVAFTPLLLKVLIEEKKYGWLAAFMLFVMGPPVGVWIWLDGNSWNWVAGFISLGAFYFYCASLRLVIPRWYHPE